MIDMLRLSGWAVEEWNGFRCMRGEVDGRACRLVLPEMGMREDNRWAWRAEFFGAFANTDVELVRRGYVLAYMDVQAHFGAPKAMRHFDKFYEFVTGLGLNSKAAMIGLSRGGLFIYNWATLHPGRIACLYGDAPVCDIRSWPCSPSMLEKFPNDTEQCLAMYGLTVEELQTKYQSPIDNIGVIAWAGIPIIHVCGDADQVVSIADNTIPLITKYMQAGGLDCRLIIKHGCGHHPHGLEDPSEVVAFIEHSFDRLR